ncbi:hypothetical protein GCM10007079_38020 [Nocardiopsis terrae]|uniref:Fatty acid desaturase n=1 Tax=Nocardiopsis terrae TaxID=372655 RepID=A0ABR9HDS8_9ACTN|nr:hypothetical protein [Nocardiopsis terrae]MBE1457189.1 fatty acid desaturase [Nocardiopsis terrae]GHC91062.1 hypothetical protein GCM10007079_38020 [Nocardiopsis terrae]
MNDPNRSARSPGGAGARQSRSAVRTVLWLLILLGATANAVTSFGDFHPLVSVGFGLVTVLFVVLLARHHLRHRG